VWILDFSYAPGTLVEIANQAGNVHLLDHHKTAFEAWKEYLIQHDGTDDNVQIDIPQNLNIDFDMYRSGAMMALDFFAGTDVYDKMFEFLQDRDLWRFENPDTKYFTRYLRLHPKDFSTWNDIAESLNTTEGYSGIMEVGKYLEVSFSQQCSEIIATGKREVWIDGVKGLECNCPGVFASDIGNILATESGTFGHTWQLRDGFATHSLRSNGDFDISAWAKRLGGGGHKNAAGFKVDNDNIDTFSTMFSRPGKVI
jgi:oligoribonuclease NrnB/cAMP/cGMP phosphodiesterase (DHH superfamily)